MPVSLKKLTSGAFLFALFGSGLVACSNSGQQFEKMSWLSGRWEKESNGMKIIETWQRENGIGFLVQGYMLENADTVFTEFIKVTLKQGTIIYAVTLPDQNGTEPVTFKLTENTGQKVVFENPEHDYPQKITYQKHRADSMLVQLEGRSDQALKKQEYFLKRTDN